MAKKTKTVITIEKETAIVLETAATTKKDIMAIIETAAVAARALKIFIKRNIITTEEKTVIIAAKAFRNDGIASFDRKVKYIWINGNAMVFALEKVETALIKT